MEDLEFVMGGSLEGLARLIPGVGPFIDAAKEVPGAIEEVKGFINDNFPSDAQIQQSQSEGQASAQSAAVSSQQVSDAAHASDSAAAEHAQLANGVY